MELYEESLESYTRALEIDPTYATGYYNRSLTYTAMDEDELADEDLKLAEQYGYFD